MSGSFSPASPEPMALTGLDCSSRVDIPPKGRNPDPTPLPGCPSAPAEAHLVTSACSRWLQLAFGHLSFSPPTFTFSLQPSIISRPKRAAETPFPLSLRAHQTLRVLGYVWKGEMGSWATLERKLKWHDPGHLTKVAPCWGTGCWFP